MKRILSAAAHDLNVIYARIYAMSSPALLSVVCYLQ
jgi:hypothetical protein